MNRNHEQRTLVVGCALTTHDLQFVRFEYCALVSVAFDVPGRVVFYTKVLDRPNLEDRAMANEKIVLRRILGGLWKEDCFGIHELNGGAFETIIPERNRRRSPTPDDDFDRWMAEQEEREQEEVILQDESFDSEEEGEVEDN